MMSAISLFVSCLFFFASLSSQLVLLFVIRIELENSIVCNMSREEYCVQPHLSSPFLLLGKFFCVVGKFSCVVGKFSCVVRFASNVVSKMHS